MSNQDKKMLEQRYSVGKKYLRAKEVAEYLGIGMSTVWLYAKQGKLNPKKISSRVTVFNIDNIEAFIESNVDGVS